MQVCVGSIAIVKIVCCGVLSSSICFVNCGTSSYTSQSPQPKPVIAFFFCTESQLLVLPITCCLCPDAYFADLEEPTTFARILSSAASIGQNYTAGGANFHRMSLLFHACAVRAEYVARRMRSPFQGSESRETANQFSAKAQLKDTVVRIFCCFFDFCNFCYRFHLTFFIRCLAHCLQQIR